MLMAMGFEQIYLPLMSHSQCLPSTHRLWRRGQHIKLQLNTIWVGPESSLTFYAGPEAYVRRLRSAVSFPSFGGIPQGFLKPCNYNASHTWPKSLGDPFAE